MTSIKNSAAPRYELLAALFRAAAVMSAVFVAVVPTVATAQDSESAQLAAGPVPPDTLVARYQIDPAVLDNVTNTAELVAALREHLVVVASMPLDESLQVSLSANVYATSNSFYNFQSSKLGFSVEGGQAVSSDLASVIRTSQAAESFSDWDEEEAWARLLEGLEVALADPTSLVVMASGQRERDDAGHVVLRIVAVHPMTYGEEAWELEESLERDYIKLAPRPRFSSASMAGWEPPEGFGYDVQLLYLELEPVTVVELPVVVLSADELDQFVGTYEARPGVILEIWREGDALMAAPQDDKTRVVTLTASSATEFWTDAAGSRRTFAFSFGSDGAVETLTMAQSGRSMTFPRVP